MGWFGVSVSSRTKCASCGAQSTYKSYSEDLCTFCKINYHRLVANWLCWTTDKKSFSDIVTVDKPEGGSKIYTVTIGNSSTSKRVELQMNQDEFFSIGEIYIVQKEATLPKDLLRHPKYNTEYEYN